MIKKAALIIVFTSLGYQAMSCKCIPDSEKKDLAKYTEIFAGKLIESKRDTYDFILLKSWKGTTGVDTLRVTIRQDNSCYRALPPGKDGYYLLFVDAHGIFNCSHSGFYDDSQFVDTLEEWLGVESWINKNYAHELKEIESDRKSLIHTNMGQLDTTGKRIIVATDKDVFELKMPMPIREQAALLIVIATKPELTGYSSPPDYILYMPENYSPESFSEKRKQKLIKRTMRKLNQTAL